MWSRFSFARSLLPFLLAVVLHHLQKLVVLVLYPKEVVEGRLGDESQPRSFPCSLPELPLGNKSASGLRSIGRGDGDYSLLL